MESERKSSKHKRQVSEKNTPFNIKERQANEAAEARESNPYLMQLFSLFLPGAGNRGRPKFITDKYGNRVRSGMESKKKERQ